MSGAIGIVEPTTTVRPAGLSIAGRKHADGKLLDPVLARMMERCAANGPRDVFSVVRPTIAKGGIAARGAVTPVTAALL